MSDDKLIITAEQAESLLNDGPTIHNFVQCGGAMLVGCDYDRAEALKAFADAKLIEIGGDGCKTMGHALAVWKGEPNDIVSVSFFEADKDKVAAFEAAQLEKA